MTSLEDWSFRNANNSESSLADANRDSERHHDDADTFPDIGCSHRPDLPAHHAVPDRHGRLSEHADVLVSTGRRVADRALRGGRPDRGCGRARSLASVGLRI